MTNYSIGIDLGTKNSCISYMKDGKTKTTQIIVNAEGSNTTPSVVAFSESNGKEEILIGDPAKRQAVTNHANTISDAKRLIGRKFDDPEIANIKKHVSYEIVKSSNGDAWIKAGGKERSPSQISAMVLQAIKKYAEDFLGGKVTDAVITVPAYFNDSQRQATKDAGVIAGLNVQRIVNEPTAAALAYGWDKGGDKKIAVFDLGGGTFDVSILDIGEGVFEVMSTNGDTFLGGEDFDQVIQRHLIEEFKASSGVDISSDMIARQRLRDAAEKAKIELSSRNSVDINIPYLTADATGPKHLDIKLSRAKFESMASDLISKLKTPCSSALKDAGLKVNEIDEVVMVGGMTRMPKVIEFVKEFFGKDPSRNVNPDEVVATGAAIQAGVIGGKVDDIVLLDVTPLSLGLETMGGVMTKIIEKNTTIPTSKSQTFSTAEDNQSAVTIKVYQGERGMARDNKNLGEFTLDGIPPAPRGVPQVEVSFELDANGILNVTASDKASGKKQNITIKASGGLTDDEIEAMIKESEEQAENDNKQKQVAETRNTASSAVYAAEKMLKDYEAKISDGHKSEITDKIKGINDIIEDDNEVENMKSKAEELQELLMKIGQDLYQTGDHKDSDASSEGESNEKVVDAEEN